MVIDDYLSLFLRFETKHSIAFLHKLKILGCTLKTTVIL